MNNPELILGATDGDVVAFLDALIYTLPSLSEDVAFFARVDERKYDYVAFVALEFGGATTDELSFFNFTRVETGENHRTKAVDLRRVAASHAYDTQSFSLVSRIVRHRLQQIDHRLAFGLVEAVFGFAVDAIGYECRPQVCRGAVA